MNQYYEVFISAENQDQADAILNSLLNKKLVTGGQIMAAPARFLWKGAVEEMSYITITSFTNTNNKNGVIRDVEATTLEEVPMIRFHLVEVNQKLADWIEQTLK